MDEITSNNVPKLLYKSPKTWVKSPKKQQKPSLFSLQNPPRHHRYVPQGIRANRPPWETTHPPNRPPLPRASIGGVFQAPRPGGFGGNDYLVFCSPPGQCGEKSTRICMYIYIYILVNLGKNLYLYIFFWGGEM